MGWKSGLFGCFSMDPGGMGLCCKVYFCPCLSIQEIAEHVEQGKGQSSCIICVLLGILGLDIINLFLYDCPLRQKVAEKSSITDDNAFLKVLCCRDCHLCQV